LGAVAACGGEEEASVHAFWTFAPQDGCLPGETIWFQFAPDPFGEPDIFNCMNEKLSNRQEGLIGGIPLGDYTMTGTVHDGDDPTATLAPVGPFDISLDVDGDVREQTFNFTRAPALFDVSFGLDFGAAGNLNCTGTPKGGTGVVQQRVDVVDMDDPTMCLALSVTEDDGTAVHENSCSATNSVCFETTTTVTVNDLPAGNYLLEVRGYKANDMTIPCWEQDFILDTAQYSASAVDIGDLVIPYYTGASRPMCEIVREVPIPDPPPELARN
jgi:hypothetical protein